MERKKVQSKRCNGVGFMAEMITTVALPSDQGRSVISVVITVFYHFFVFFLSIFTFLTFFTFFTLLFT